MALKKELTFIDLFALAVGAMISSGIFILPGLAFAKAGPAIMLSYFLAGILAIIGSLSIIELATALPKAGGDYFFVTRSLGPLIGTISGILSWFAISLKTAFAIFGIGEVLRHFSGMELVFVPVILCVVFTGINIRGTTFVTKLEVVIVAILFLLLGGFFFLGGEHTNVQNFSPFLLHGWSSVMMSIGFVFVAFGGLIKIVSVSEEIENPQRNIPLAMLSAAGVVTVLYVLILFVTIGTLDPDKLATSVFPIADAAKQLFGEPGLIIIQVASLLAFTACAIAGIMAAARYLFGLSKDSMLPSIISKVDPRFNTPVVALLITGILLIAALFLHIETLVKAASTIILVSYVLSNISLIVLREGHIKNYRPSFTVPLYPWIPIISIIAFTALIVSMGATALKMAGGLILCAIVIYYSYGKKYAAKEYALVHFIARLINKELHSQTLEAELLEIVHQRDDITHDRFDDLARDALYLDVEGPLILTDFLDLASEQLSATIAVDKPYLYDLLKKREEETSTAITPFVAIPHIIVNGEKVFRFMILRCKEGIHFSERHPAVKAIFILMGTKDERHFHLQCLAAIAQITHNKDFERRWSAAKNMNHLRDILLLSKRYRHQ